MSDDPSGGTDIEGRTLLNAAGARDRGLFQVASFNVSGTHTNATESSFTLETIAPLTYAAS